MFGLFLLQTRSFVKNSLRIAVDYTLNYYVNYIKIPYRFRVDFVSIRFEFLLVGIMYLK